jgi:hypothetical protein
MMPDVDLSHKEKTLERSDKGKGITIQTTSSSQYISLMGTSPSWLKREVMIRMKRQLHCIGDEATKKLVESLKRLEPPIGDVQTLAFIMKNQN